MNNKYVSFHHKVELIHFANHLHVSNFTVHSVIHSGLTPLPVHKNISLKFSVDSKVFVLEFTENLGIPRYYSNVCNRLNSQLHSSI